MKVVGDIKEIDSNLTVVFINDDYRKYIDEIVCVENKDFEFKVAGIDAGKLSDREIEHLFRVFPKDTLSDWINRTHGRNLEQMVRATVHAGIRAFMDYLPKDNEELNRAGNKLVDEAKKEMSRLYNQLMKEYVERGMKDIFAEWKDERRIITRPTEDMEDEEFIYLGYKAAVLTPEQTYVWAGPEDDLALHELLAEVLAKVYGYAVYERDGVVKHIAGSREALEKLLSEKDKAVVDVWSGWCSPCRMFEKASEEFFRQRKDIALIKINVDFNDWSKELQEKYGASGIPLIIMKNKNKERVINGFHEEIVGDMERFFSG